MFHLSMINILHTDLSFIFLKILSASQKLEQQLFKSAIAMYLFRHH